MFNFAENLIQSGVSEQLVYILLALPFVAFFVSFFRYYIGLKSLGIYEPIVITFALYIISPNFIDGLKFGLPIIGISWLVSELLSRSLKDARMHYVSKVSLKISVASLLMIMALWVLAQYGQNGYFTVNPLSIIVILVLVESLGLYKIKMGDFRANLTSLETLVISIFSYLVISVAVVNDTLISYPWLVVVPILGSVLVGKWTGLRLVEYLRFKNVLKDE